MAENIQNLVKDELTDSGSATNPKQDKRKEIHTQIHHN